MRPAIVMAGVLFCALVSGCAAQSKSDSTTEVPTDIQTVQVTQDTGAIRGLVISPSITPIPDATVKLSGTNETKKTSATGSFSFSKLKPGTYFIEASKVGYSKIQTSTVVTAGDENPPMVKIQLVEDTVNRPFGEMLNWKGFLTCSFAVRTPAIGLGGDVCPAEVGEDFIHDMPFSAGIPMFTQSEMTWVGNQPLGNNMQLGYHFGGTSDWKSKAGPSPITLNATHDEIAAKGPQKEASTKVVNRVFPAASENPGVNVITNQDFKVYVTHFYNFRPHSGWTFVKEGECLRPEQCA
jgi:hypothetical protein